MELIGTTHIVQAKVEIVETGELAVGRWIPVGLKGDDARVSTISTVIRDGCFAIGHRWILQAMGKNDNVRARLDVKSEWDAVRQRERDVL